VGLICYALGVVCVYLPMKVNEEVCRGMVAKYTMIPKSMNFCMTVFNGTQCYENGSYYKYPYGKEWDSFIKSLPGEPGNDSGNQVDDRHNET
jgi:hypothetical protein